MSAPAWVTIVLALWLLLSVAIAWCMARAARRMPRWPQVDLRPVDLDQRLTGMPADEWARYEAELRHPAGGAL